MNNRETTNTDFDDNTSPRSPTKLNEHSEEYFMNDVIQESIVEFMELARQEDNDTFSDNLGEILHILNMSKSNEVPMMLISKVDTTEKSDTQICYAIFHSENTSKDNSIIEVSANIPISDVELHKLLNDRQALLNHYNYITTYVQLYTFEEFVIMTNLGEVARIVYTGDNTAKCSEN